MSWGLGAVLLLVGCGGKEDEECARVGAFSACEERGVAGVCVMGACEPIPACDGVCSDAIPLSDTNLRACMGPAESGADGTIHCPGIPGTAGCATTDYCGQDAQYGADVDGSSHGRFDRIGTADEPVVRDGTTGLEWQGCSAGQAGGGCAGHAALGDWHTSNATCEEAGWAGFDDWRLPRATELHSIVDFSTTSPAIDLEAFPNTPSRFADDYDAWWIECVWSGTDYADNAEVAWVLMSNNGDIAEGSGTTYHLNDKDAAGWEGCYTRCVREPGSATAGRFLLLDAVADEPVVADVTTERLWQGCSAGQTGAGCEGQAEMFDWKGSLAYCQGLSYGGIDDWRLPDVKELRSIVDLSHSHPAIDPAFFPNTPYYGPSVTPNVGNYWSSTARWYNGFALYVDFGSGFSHFYVMDETRHARCVSG